MMAGPSQITPEVPVAAVTGPAPPGPESAAAPGGSGISVARSLRKHRRLAAMLALAVILTGVPVAWLKGQAKYGVTAVIYVSPRFLANLQDSKEVSIESDSQYHEYVQQNARTINRFDIVLEAVKKAGTVWIRPGEGMEHAAERLQGALEVKSVPDPYQITVSLESPKQAGLAELVNAVVHSYLGKAKSEELYASDERVSTLLDDRAKVQAGIAEKQEKRLAIAQEIGVSSFTENVLNPYDKLLSDGREALSAVRRLRIDADAQLAMLDEKQRAGGADSLLALAQAEALKDVALTSLESNESNRRTQLLTAISGLSPDHPGRRAAERELAELAKEQEKVSRRILDGYSKSLLAQRQAEAFRATRVEQKLSEEVDRLTSQTTWFTRNYQEGLQLGLAIDALRKRMDGVQQRIDFLSLEKTAPGTVRMFSAARPPQSPMKGGRKRLLGMAVVAGLMIGLLAPMGIDFFDPKLHTPRDAQKILGFPPMVWLMEKSDAGPEFAREQIMRLASRIAQDRQTNNSRIFAFTSVKARGGTSTIVVETANALGYLGLPALAVEANAYRADPRYRDPKSRGLTVVLHGNADLYSAVVPGDSEMPDYLPIGDVSNQKNLPDIQNLIEILRNSAEAYSIVLVDLPPILISVDAEFIARAADVSVLVIEAEAVTKGDLQRATASLQRIQAPAVSAIFNRARADAGDGYARAALTEFRTGMAPRGGGLLWSWLFK